MRTRYLITPDRMLMDELVIYLTLLEGLFAAAEHARKGRVELDRGHEGIMFAKHTGLSVILPMGGLVASALSEEAVDGVTVGIEARQGHPGHLDQKTSGLRALLASIAERLVVGFFQKSRTDLRAAHGQSRTSWPDSWQMWLARP